jgi:hypothetical protein
MPHDLAAMRAEMRSVIDAFVAAGERRFRACLGRREQ